MRRTTRINPMRRFLGNQDGTTAIEYAVIASGIAGVLVVTITSLGGTITALWQAVAGLFG